MNTLIVNLQQTMTSLEIAELTGKQHKDVMRAIRKMEPAWVKVNGRNFALVEYKDAKGELRPCYQLTKTECLYIATKFNDEARARLVLRWEELERRSLTPNPKGEGRSLTPNPSPKGEGGLLFRHRRLPSPVGEGPGVRPL